MIHQTVPPGPKFATTLTMTDRVWPCLLTQFWILSVLLAPCLKPAASETYLRQRASKEGASDEEFGRTLKLFLNEHQSHVTKQRTTNAKKSLRLTVSHHAVDEKNKEEMSSIEKDTEIAGFESRMLDLMSLSMSMQIVPTLAPTVPPVMIRLPAPTTSPTYAPSLEPSLVPVTPGPTEYLEPTPLATYAPTTLPSSYIAQTPSPSKAPTPIPTQIATSSPSMYIAQTPAPSKAPTPIPTQVVTSSPSVYLAPTPSPTKAPIPLPTEAPTPTPAPTQQPYIDAATYLPTPSPNRYPTFPPAGDATVRVLSVQQQAGVCSGPSNGVGCASESEEMQGGNPNDIVNCFSVENVGLSPPFQLTTVRFWLGDSTVPPADLSIQVWAGTVAYGPTTTNLYSQALNGFVPGENSVQLDETLLILEAEFCVGVQSASIEDGLRIQTDGGQSDRASYLMSPRCGLPEFKSLGDIAGPGDFCIEAMVTEGER
jgi:hypothetical protein